MAELADALDSKFRNHRFYLVTCGETPFTIFIGKSSLYQPIVVINEG